MGLACTGFPGTLGFVGQLGLAPRPLVDSRFAASEDILRRRQDRLPGRLLGGGANTENRVSATIESVMTLRNPESDFTLSPPRPQGTAPPAHRLPEERRLVAWVGKSVIFKGDLISSEDITIDGRVEGTVEVRNHRLTIGPHADIHADIVAKAVTVHGSLTGSIIAAERVEILATGSVEGDITSPRFTLVDGAILRGRVDAGTQGRASQPAAERKEPASTHSV